jgi:O-methyltransferase involved in polyketide biosynthesis
VEPARPLFVIAEGLMMYLPPEAQRDLWGRVRRLGDLAGDVRLVFDLVPACEQPKPGVVGRTLEAAMKAFTGGRTFERDARTRSDIAEEVRRAGFARVDCTEPHEVAGAWGLPFPEMRTQQLLFDARST